MIPEATKTECCPILETLPANIECFVPDIRKEIKALVRRHRCMFTRRKRLLEMAVPVTRKNVFVPKCPCLLGKPVNIVRTEVTVHTRTEQLSYPPARRLLLFRNRVKGLFEEDRMAVLNRLTRLSLLSLYSRLANVQPPEPSIPIHKWDENEWKTHMKYIRKLAKPKDLPKLARVPVKRMPLKQMKRFKKLAKPKYFEELPHPEWTLTPSMKYYTPTERIAKLATVKPQEEDVMNQELPIKIPTSALKYKPSKRIQELSTPPEKRTAEPDVRDDAFVISANALKAKASKRILELAEPKEYENSHIRDNPNAISPAALKAKASPRIIELAKPKGS